jgi:hypothetical protein
MERKRTNRRYRVIIRSEPAEMEGRPGLWDRHFRLLAFGVVLISILTREKRRKRGQEPSGLLMLDRTGQIIYNDAAGFSMPDA